MKKQFVIEKPHIEPALPASHQRQPYQRPAIVYETEITTRAGSPGGSAFRPEQDPANIWDK
jgi:hypothetical protein